MTPEGFRVAIFGLGEAGSLIAADLAKAGAHVHGYDPAAVATPAGIVRHETPGPSVESSLMVLAVTAAVDAKNALGQSLSWVAPETIYADLSTAPPSLKEDLASTAVSKGLLFVDVALMGTVPGNGLATPSLASGPGAARFAAVINEVGGNVRVVGDRPGEAAARKLLRSVVTKGLTALLMEALEAAAVHGEADWLRDHLVELITEADGTLLDRFISGTFKHIDRRIVEMESAREFFESLAVPAPMTTATVDTLRRIRSEGLPSNLDSQV
jgi:3-hydroxyisobutyrate dehydrogenase-like beta-hydroxyacid dehydrogenase